jgi:trehalose 6-phosphate phosphatase
MTENGPGPAWPERPALFLDLDGTLLEFSATPDEVELTPRFRRVLARLERVDPRAVAFISGRTIAKLDRLLAPHRFALAGVHGSERRASDGSVIRSDIDPLILDPLRALFSGFESAHGGTLVEDKGISLALHYRQVPELRDAIARFTDEVARELPGSLSLLEGDHVLEIRPATVSKGAAIRDFMGERPFAGRTPVFVGDDVTDEAGFEVVNELDGISVKVNHGPTVARWRLPGVGAVLTWLERNIPA